MHGKLPHVRVANTRNKTARTRKGFKIFKNLTYFDRETSRNIFISLAVPRESFSELPASAFA
jgi:hypothetical protein